MVRYRYYSDLQNVRNQCEIRSVLSHNMERSREIAEPSRESFRYASCFISAELTIPSLDKLNDDGTGDRDIKPPCKGARVIEASRGR